MFNKEIRENYLSNRRLIALSMAAIIVVVTIWLGASPHYSEIKSIPKLPEPSQESTQSDNSQEEIPYNLEIDKDSASQAVSATLAIGQVTIIHCPEKPEKILLADKDMLDYQESVVGEESIIYLQPLTKNLTSNMVIELKSSVIILSLKTVEFTNPTIGNFTGEITIKTHNDKDDLAQARLALAKSEDQVAKLENEVAQKDQLLKVVNEQIKELKQPLMGISHDINYLVISLIAVVAIGLIMMIMASKQFWLMLVNLLIPGNQIALPKKDQKWKIRTALNINKGEQLWKSFGSF